MNLHSNSATCPKIRACIKASSSSCRELAATFRVSPSTTHTWKNRTEFTDRSSRPHTLRQAMDPACQATALILRKAGLTLDECLDGLLSAWNVARATLHRFFCSQGLGRLHVREKQQHGTFADYEPGFLHIDSSQLPAIGGVVRYVFVAIDRATRLVYVALYDNKTMESAVSFLKAAHAFFPFNIHRVLTDNGAEFTNKRFARWKGSECTKEHLFEALCEALGIRHKTTKPYSPKTNGMVERYNRNFKDATLGRRRYDCLQRLERDILASTQIYNHRHKHSGLNYKTPWQEVLRWYTLKPDIFNTDPTCLKAEPFATS